MRSFLRSVVGAVVAFVLVLVAQAQHARTREYLPRDPGYDIDFLVEGDDDDGYGDPLSMIVLGDSTVAGVGAPAQRDSLAVQIAVKVARDTGRSVHVVGHGVTGARTRDVLEDQVTLVPAGGVDVVVVEIGSNDVTHLTDLGQLSRDTEELLRLAKQRASVVVLGSAGRLNSINFMPPLRQLVMWRANYVRAAQGAAARAAGARFMDVAVEVSPAYEAAGPAASSSDGFHPSELGYEIWAGPLARHVVEGIGELGQAASSATTTGPALQLVR
jgi:lysophospholipase L1-like esterase